MPCVVLCCVVWQGRVLACRVLFCVAGEGARLPCVVLWQGRVGVLICALGLHALVIAGAVDLAEHARARVHLARPQLRGRGAPRTLRMSNHPTPPDPAPVLELLLALL